MRIPSTLLQTFLLFFFFTSNAQESLKDFYYTFGEKKETKVYKYADPNNPTYVFYWVVILDPEKQSIQTDSYDKDFVKGDSFYEVLEKKGARLKTFSVFEKNFFGFQSERKAEVIRDKVYAWNIKNKNTYFYEVTYTDRYGKTKMVKSRLFREIDSISVQGTMYNTAKFEDAYQIDVLDREDYSYSFVQFSYYAEGLGMIKYRRYGEGFVIEVELVEILSIEEFEKLKKSKK